MLELKKISLKEYLELEDTSEYDFLMKYSYSFAESKNIFNIPDYTEWSFGFVNDYTFMVNNGMSIHEQIKYIDRLLNEFEYKKNIGILELKEYCLFRNFINDCIINIANIESELLSNTPSKREIEAGIDTKFKGLENHIKLSYLCNGDLTKAKEIEKLSWAFCFNELLYRNRTTNFQKDLQKTYE